MEEVAGTDTDVLLS